MIDTTTIQKIKDAANVVDVIGDYYTLKRDGTGGKFTCLCPFHEDRHLGSFKVSESRNVYTCFACGAHGGPVDFLMNHENMTFVESIKWLGAKYGIAVEGSEAYTPRPAKPHDPPKPLPMLTLDKKMVSTLKARNEQNTLCKWLRGLPWDDDQKRRVEKMIGNYQIGHGKEGHTVFWQIDEDGKVRTGKMMLYKEDGHRDKESKHNFDFIHSVLLRNKMWDDEKFDYQTCYFGQHLIDFCPHATINLVESEKTALICAIAFGTMQSNLWIATGGLSNLTAEKLKPFIERERTIVVYPDHDGKHKWKERVKDIGYSRMIVNHSMMDMYWRPEDGDKADIADVIIRMMYDSKANILSKWSAENPALDTLINTFDLRIK